MRMARWTGPAGSYDHAVKAAIGRAVTWLCLSRRRQNRGVAEFPADISGFLRADFLHVMQL